MFIFVLLFLPFFPYMILIHIGLFRYCKQQKKVFFVKKAGSV